MSYQIKNRWTEVLWTSETSDSLMDALILAVSSGADLRDANLRDADLCGAYLRGANLRRAGLRGADLRGANLRRANLRGADLRRANLSDANLSDANLSDADLCGANLSDANLRRAGLRGADLCDADLCDADLCDADLCGANLRDANLRRANLSDADLRGADLCDADLCDADLTPLRDDLWAVLSSSPAEAIGLRAAIIEGRIDGSTYRGECACLVGTIANVRKCDVDSIPGLSPDPGRPIERFFTAIAPGDVPEKSQPARIALEWIDQWLANI